MNLLKILTPVLLLASGVVDSHSAQPEDSDPPPTPTFSISKSLVPTDEEGNYDILYWLVADSYKIAFRPPPNWTLSGDPQQHEFILQAPKNTGRIAFSWFPSEPIADPQSNRTPPQPESPPLDPQSLIESFILAQFPEAEQITSYPTNGCGVLGITQEWWVKRQPGMRLYLRSSLFPLPEGNIRVLMVTSEPSQILHGNYTFFQNSFQFQRGQFSQLNPQTSAE